MTLPGYELEETLGRGAMGTVHRARRLDWAGRVVAVKRVTLAADPALAARLRHEAEVLAGLDHPHIVRILELVPDGDGVAIVMQYAAGGSLAGLLAARGRLAPEEAVAVAVPLADALTSAHRRGVLHCDVKPSNVPLSSDGEPLLSDFGLARWAARGSLGSGTLVGTAEYLDPAVTAGATPDERSDVYALGAVCYEMLAGRPPFVGPSPLAVLRAADTGCPPPLGEVAPGVPPALAQVVEQALARDPAQRPPDAATMAVALRRAVTEPALPALAPPDALPGPPPPRGPASDGGHRPPPHEPPTRTFGPRPPRPAPPRPASPRRPAGRAALVVAAATLAVAAVVTGLVLRPTPTGGPPGDDRPQRGCAPVPGPYRADVDGDGCATKLSWDGHVLEVEGRRYQLGQLGDVLLLGDWDCDGRDTPALYRPGTGTVSLFHGWAEPDRPLPASSTERRPAAGVASVARGGDGCEEVAVTSAAS